jgi:hypothetical protein
MNIECTMLREMSRSEIRYMPYNPICMKYQE